MTFSLVYAFSENYVLPLSHDEVVHEKGSLLGKMPGDSWQKFAGVRTLLAYMWAHPGKQLLFMGGEFAQGGEWAEQRSLDWWLLEGGDGPGDGGDGANHAGVRRLVADLNRAYRSRPAMWAADTVPDGFRWIDANDAAGNVLSFLRYAGRPGEADGRGSGSGSGAGSPGAGSGPEGTERGDTDVVACVVNFAGQPHEDYRIGLPFAGRWRELVNTDAFEYGGSGVGNLGAVEAVAEPWHGLPASATLRVPPLGALWLTPDR
jgi:1,4-alpha-glucan branching enzyme